MLKIKYFIVWLLEQACHYTHIITLHRPFVLLPGMCHLAKWSGQLDDRWETGVWKAVKDE